MYLECDNKAERARAFTIAKKVAELVAHVDRGSALALDHLVGQWVEKGDITPPIIQVWIPTCLYTNNNHRHLNKM